MQDAPREVPTDLPTDIPGDMPHHHVPHGFPAVFGTLMVVFSAVSFLFWIWMCVDRYRRCGGLDYWHYLFFFFPVSTLVYFILHFRQIVGGRGARGGGASLFGPSTKKKIETLRTQLRLADTLAVHFELGELLYQNKEYAACESEFRTVLAAEPNNVEAQYYIGLCRMQLNDPLEALPFLKQVVVKDRNIRMGIAWLEYTKCLVANQLRDEALEERRKLSRAFPRPLTEYAYAELLHDMGDKDKSRAILEDMLATSQQAPREDRPWLTKGRTLLRSL